MRALYLSHVGLSEPLGRSQVLPYLQGVARSGVELEILAFEKADANPDAVSALREELKSQGLRYQPLARRASHSLAAKLVDAAEGTGILLARALARRPRVIHARGYVPAAIADVIATSSPGSKLLFDCRGMLGDEYIDSGNWTEDRVEYRMLKRFERRVFRRADGLVILTHALESWLVERAMLGEEQVRAVIPCCVDTEKFVPNSEARARLRAEWNLGERLVVAYSGSLGTWYLQPEMARFAAAVKRLRADAVFLLLSQSNPDELVGELRSCGFADGDIVVRKVQPTAMPEALTTIDVGLSFIKSCFSKLGSSPTKVAEYLAAGAPVVLNGDIGDQASLAESGPACVVIPDFAESTMDEAAVRAVREASRSYEERARGTHAIANAEFGLASIGVPRYVDLYKKLA